MTDNTLPNTDPTINSRFTDLGGGTYSEAMAPMVVLHYDVNTMAARCQFHCQPYLSVGGSYRLLGDEVMDVLEVDFATEMDACYGAGLTDPVTGQDLGGFSVAGMMLKIKAALDIKHNQRAQIRLLATALAEARAQRPDAVDSPADNGTQCSFTYSASGLTVSFLDTSTDGSGQPPMEWSWIFGDQYGSSTAENPVHTYAVPGTYVVSLVVTDASGKKVISKQTIVVDEVVEAPASTPTEAPAPAPTGAPDPAPAPSP